VRSWPPSCFGWVDDYRELTVLPAGVAGVELKRWILFMAPQQTSASDRSRTRLAACVRSRPARAAPREPECADEELVRTLAVDEQGDDVRKILHARNYPRLVSRAANGQQTCEIGFAQACGIDPRLARKAARIERFRIHRRRSS